MPAPRPFPPLPVPSWLQKRASETPTAADLVTIRGLVAEAVRAGAAGACGTFGIVN